MGKRVQNVINDYQILTYKDIINMTSKGESFAKKLLRDIKGEYQITYVTMQHFKEYLHI